MVKFPWENSYLCFMTIENLEKHMRLFWKSNTKAQVKRRTSHGPNLITV